MISRAVDALVAAAATVAAILGLTTLTEHASWLGSAVWICLAVAAAGLLLRWLTSVKVLVLLGQVVLTAWALVAVAVVGAYVALRVMDVPDATPPTVLFPLELVHATGR